MSDGEGWDKLEGLTQMRLLCRAHPDLRVQTVAFGAADALTLDTMAAIGGGSFHTAQVGKTGQLGFLADIQYKCSPRSPGLTPPTLATPPRPLVSQPLHLRPRPRAR